jgi:small subunit ribosomal protein S8
MITDPIADMLTRIRNAYAVRKDTVRIPYSRLKESIAHVLAEEGYIGECTVVEEGGFKILSAPLKYVHRNIPVIRSIKRVSKPGCRRYVKKEELPVVLNNLGIAILSTSQGVMTNKQAKKLKIGGEILCEVS